MIQNVELYDALEKIFAAGACICAVGVFLFFLLLLKKKNRRQERTAVRLFAVIVMIVLMYGSRTVFAQDETDLPSITVLQDNWPETSVFNECTEVQIRNENAGLQILVQTVEEVPVSDAVLKNEKEAEFYEEEPSEMAGSKILAFDVPDESAYRFTVSACVDGNVETQVSFIIDKRKKETSQTEPVLTEKPKDPASETETPEPTIPLEEAEYTETPSPPTVSPGAGETQMPVQTEKPEKTEGPFWTEEPEPVPTDFPEEGSGTENPEKEDHSEKPVQPKTPKETPSDNDKKKEEYTVTIRHDGSVYRSSTESPGDPGQMYLSEMSQLTIIEYNPNRLEASLVSYTLNGETVVLQAGADYTVDSEKDEDGWKYIYRFKESVFENDGYYRINILSTDEFGRKNNNSTSGTDVRFVIDRSSPQIIVTGLENGKAYPEKEHRCMITVRDNTMPDRFIVYQNGKVMEEYLFDGEKWNNKKTKEDQNTEGTFSILLRTGGAWSDYEFYASDKSGNETRTESFRIKTGRDTSWIWAAIAAGLIAFLSALYKIKKGTHR